MRHWFTALLSGLIFGAGLALSGMINPAKVLAFLDAGGLARRTWDPSLMLVMAAALAAAAPGFWYVRRRNLTLFGEKPTLPDTRRIDARLAIGALLFGAGWGLAGFCPGPAIATLLSGAGGVAIFIAGMAAGMTAFSLTLGRQS